MNEHPATLLRCVVERITYQNPENGYSVLKVKVKGYNDLVTLVGNLLEVPVGSVLLCRGEWKVDKRYGSQFVAATWEETMPATVYGIENTSAADWSRASAPGSPGLSSSDSERRPSTSSRRRSNGFTKFRTSDVSV